MAVDTDTYDTDRLEAPAPPPAGSLLGKLRAQHDELASRKTTLHPIPGYRDPELIAEFRLLSADEIKSIGARIRHQFDDDEDRILFGLMDQAIAACDRICVRPAGSADLIPLEEAANASPELGPITFSDGRLAEIFGYEASTAREALRGVFSGNDVAAFEYVRRLSEWMANTSIKLDRELGLGEA